MIGKLGFRAAVTVKDTVQKKMEERSTPQSSPKGAINNVKDFEKALNQVGGDRGPSSTESPKSNHSRRQGKQRPEHYISDDDSTRG